MVKVKMVKETMMPRTIPNGFFFPPVVVDERIIGRSGQIQGAAMVTKPEIKANKSKMSITFYDA